MYMCMHTQMHMTKTISLADDAYEDLLAIKQDDESFSELARRLAWEARRNDFFDRSLRVDMTEDELIRRKLDVARARDEASRPRYEHLFRQLAEQKKGDA